MIILGIDPGIGRCGWGIVENDKSKLIVHDYGCIETKPNSEISSRLKIIYDEVERIIKKYNPDEISIEELFFGANSKTAFAVGKARGVILLSAARAGIPIGIYTPLEVKMAVTGYGRADKNQIAQMVKVILKLSSIPKFDDTTDALAIAIAHAFSSKIKSKL